MLNPPEDLEHELLQLRHSFFRLKFDLSKAELAADRERIAEQLRHVRSEIIRLKYRISVSRNPPANDAADAT